MCETTARAMINNIAMAWGRVLNPNKQDFDHVCQALSSLQKLGLDIQSEKGRMQFIYGPVNQHILQSAEFEEFISVINDIGQSNIMESMAQTGGSITGDIGTQQYRQQHRQHMQRQLGGHLYNPNRKRLYL